MRRAFVTAILALAFGLTAALVDAEPLWVPATTLLAIAAGSAAWVGFGARGVRITRALGARRVMEDEPLAIVLDVRAGRMGLPPSRICDPLMSDPVALRAGTAGGRIGRVRIEVRFGRRGRRRLALPRVVVADPLGLATREVSARPSPSSDEVLVLPRIEPVVAAPGGGDATRIARHGLPVGGAEVELDGIRPLRDGTPAARIFWPAVARGADPQERFLVAASESRPVVVLDPRGAANDDALDAAVRAAASLAHALAESGGCSVLLPGDRRPVDLGETLAGWAHMHARLALVGSTSGPSLVSLAQRRGPIVFVSARMRTRMPQALGPAHGATRILVVPGALVDRRAMFAVAGCRGYELGRPARGGGARRAAGAGKPRMSTTGVPPAPPPPELAPVERSRTDHPAPPRRPAAASPALLPAHVARLIGFVALAGFGALQWAQMVRPGASDALLGCLLVCAAAGAALSAVARRRPPARLRLAVTVLAGAALLLLALAAAGIPLRYLGPRGWDDLAGGIAQGLGAVSTVRTPYDGADEWTRTVIVLGGCALIALAALLAFAPRRRGAFGMPGGAAVALGALYTLPVMQHDIRLPYLAGLLFALLLAAFLWLERVERRSAGMAAALVAVAALTGYVAAPSLDGDRPLLDYEELAQSLSAAETSQYRWNHDYGPLDWPRDGREVLRVRAAHRAYWKAVNLVAFDGTRWVHNGRQAPDGQETLVYERGWVQRIRVTLRALRTSQFVAAGTTLDIRDSPRIATSLTPGTYETTGEPLRRGHAYRAVVYTPRPTNAQLRRAGSDYSGVQSEYAILRLPAQDGGRASASRSPAGPRGRGDGPAVFFPLWGQDGAPQLLGTNGADATAAIAASAYARVYALAQRLREGADTPFDYVRAVERHLARDEFSYSERPRPSPVPLAEFLLRDRVGYCQQFSGAMALLLRMGGVPARVASGFSPGARDEERGEYVVRDVDAHSWVEVFVPGVGWVVRDPTPAAAPARAQAADLAGAGDDDTVAFGGSERALERAPDAGLAALPATTAQDSGPSTLVVIGGGLGALAAIATLALLVRRRRRRLRGGGRDDGVDDDLVELHRALRRSGRATPPQMTLEALALRFDGTPAKRYVQTLADARYGYGDRAPTRAERAALRHELGVGLGPAGRLRAWWALPPLRSPRRGARSPRGVVSSKHVV